MKLRTALIAVLATLAVVVAPSLSSARIPIFDVSAAKDANGTYQTGSQDASIGESKTKHFYWKVESNAGGDQSMSFDDALTGESDDGYKIKWYKGKKPKSSKNISSDVKGSGFGFTLKNGKRKFFSAEVTRQPGAGTLCLGGQARNDPQTYFDAAYFNVNGICS